MKSSDIQAPALARGLAVLDRLRHRPLTLEALARELRLPKASLLRLCRTLEVLGLIGRADDTKAFYAKAHLMPVDTADLTTDVERLLPALAAETGQTAEWYIHDEAGMVLLRRADPPRGEVAVRARTGFTQGWTGELDAIVALGLAFFRKTQKDKAGPTDHRNFWTYVAPGQRGNLPVRQARRKVKDAAETALVQDTVVNGNGVRRTGVLITRQGRPVGVLAVAEYAALGNAPQTPNIPTALRRAAEQLSGEKWVPVAGKT